MLVFAFSYILNITDLVLTAIALPLGAVELNQYHQHFNTAGISFLDVFLKLSIPFIFFVSGFLSCKYYPKLGVVVTVIAIGILFLYADTVFGNVVVLRELLSLWQILRRYSP